MKSIISILLSLLVIYTSVQSPYAQEVSPQGKVASLKKGEKAPFAGVLLDEVGAAKISLEKKYYKIEIELELRKEFDRQLLEKETESSLLRSDLFALQETYDEVVEIKEKQIQDLNEILKEEMGPDYSSLWFAGGVVAGILVSIAIFFAATEVAK